MLGDAPFCTLILFRTLFFFFGVNNFWGASFCTLILFRAVFFLALTIVPTNCNYSQFLKKKKHVKRKYITGK